MGAHDDAVAILIYGTRMTGRTSAAEMEAAQ